MPDNANSDWLRDAIAAKHGRPVDNAERETNTETDEPEGIAQ